MTSTGKNLHQAVHQGISALCRVVVGKHRQIQRSVAVLLSRGHLLIEDLPGVGKTTLAKGLCHIMGGSFQRIQGTNDLLPGDLLGVHIWDAPSQAFQFHPGPVFTNVLLIDELNRIGPKTQSALLEVMVEGQVTLDRYTHPLPKPFFVIATQNPMDHAGTFPLPETQLDRFSSVVHLGYASSEAEKLIFSGQAGADHLHDLKAALSIEEWQTAQILVQKVLINDAALDYAERVISRLRHAGAFCSTRAASHWLAVAKAEAWLAGRSFVTPDDLQGSLGDAMAHRGNLDERRLNRDDRREQLARVLKEVNVGWKS